MSEGCMFSGHVKVSDLLFFIVDHLNNLLNKLVERCNYGELVFKYTTCASGSGSIFDIT